MNDGFKVLLIEGNPRDIPWAQEMLLKARKGAPICQQAKVRFGIGRLVSVRSGRSTTGDMDAAILDPVSLDSQGFDILVKTQAQASQVPVIALLDLGDAELAQANKALQAEIIRRKQAEEMLERKMEQLADLHRASQVMTASLELDQVLAEFVSLAGEIATSTSASVALVDEEGRLSQSAKDLPGVPAIEYPFREDGLTNWIIRSHQAIVVDDIDEDGTLRPRPADEAPCFANPLVVEAGVRSFAGLPLAVQGRLLGVLYLHSPHPGNYHDQLTLLTTFANQMATAIENARLFSEARRRFEELKRTRVQLMQLARLAVVDERTAKVAHDFNNLLTAITGYSDLSLDVPDIAESVRADLVEIKKNADRGILLTRQLLTCSRKQVLEPQILDLSALLFDLEKMLRCLLDKNIDLRVIEDPALGKVEADPGQIEQVLMNLVTNARDAMQQGGRLTIEIRSVDLDRSCACQGVEITPGSYVMLAVSDTGIGMDEETLSRIFEPFFTTKEKDKGTGLGLPIVYEVVRQSGGYIEVDSTPDCGTTFRIYLPRVQDATEQVARSREPAESCGSQETSVVVSHQIP